MPRIYVSNLADLDAHLESVRPSHLVSMLADDEFPATPPWIPAGDHLRLQFHDIPEPEEGLSPPEARHIRQLIEFARRWPSEAPIVVHCYAGVSRSSAAALTVLALKNPGREAEAAELLRARSPHAMPNPLMIQLIDEELELGGRLIAAVEDMGEPDFSTMGTLVELPARLG